MTWERGQRGYQRSDISDQEARKSKNKHNAEAQSSQRIAEKNGETQDPGTRLWRAWGNQQTLELTQEHRQECLLADCVRNDGLEWCELWGEVKP